MGERTVSWSDPHELARQGVKMGGLEFLQAMRRGEVPPPPIAELLGFGLETVEPGRVVFWLEPGEHLYNPLGMVHGGVAATLSDTAMGCAIHTRIEPGSSYTTLELKINFVRPVLSSSGRILCEAKVVHSGNRVATAEARVTDANGKLFAHASTTCLVLPKS